MRFSYVKFSQFHKLSSYIFIFDYIKKKIQMKTIFFLTHFICIYTEGKKKKQFPSHFILIYMCTQTVHRHYIKFFFTSITCEILFYLFSI